MSNIENPNNGAAGVVVPFPSLPALHAAHLELLRLQRENGVTAALIASADEFIQRGSASGVLLDTEADRETAQGLLDYWATILYRDGHEPPDATLADFDADLAPALPDSLCPYVGLDAFREVNHEVFFGRQRLVQDLVERLRSQRLLAVVGPSGSGKSSVVRAGLLPALRADAADEGRDWHEFPPVEPGADPLRSLARTARPLGAPLGWAAGHVEQLRQDPGQLAKLVAATGATAAVLCVDQFEELFTLAEEEGVRRAFIDNLLYLVDMPDADHKVILTMRSDFEAFVARVPALQERFAAARVPVTPMSAGELREAIERPAALVGLKFEDGVVDALLQDILGEPAALPLLQFTLLKLWEHRQRNRVTMDAYRRLGGGRLALARSADEFYASLIPEDQVAARRILLRMVRPGEGLEVTSSRVRRADLYRAGEAHDRVDRVLEKLIRARLVRVSGGDTPEDEQIEVAHEALVRNWPTLVEWLDDERAALAMRRRLEAKATEWVRLGRGSSGLLDHEQLLEAEHWIASREAAYVGFDPALPELVAASRAAIAEAEQEQEGARQRELAQARALAEEQQRRAEAERKRAELEAQTNRRLRIFFRLLAVMAILAAGAAIWALGAQQLAVERFNSLQEAVVETDNARATAEANRAVAEANRATAEANRATAEAYASSADISRATAIAAQATAEALGANEAQRRRTDRANLLAAVSHAVLENRPQLGLLLAVESLRVTGDVGETPVLTATNALREALAATAGRGLAGHTAPVRAVALSDDGARMVTGGDDGTVRLWNLRNPNPAASQVALPGASGKITAVAITPDGQQVIAGGDDGAIRVWSAGDPQAAPRELGGVQGPVGALIVTRDGARLAASGADTAVRVWRMDDLGAAPTLLDRHTKRVTGVAVSENGGLVMTVGADGLAFLWNLAARNPPGTPSNLIPRPGRPALTGAALSRDGRWAATAGEDGAVHVWGIGGAGGAQFNTGPRILTTGTISALAIDPRNRWVVTGAPDGTVRLWALGRTGGARLSGHTGPITALAFSPDGGLLVTASADGTARVWNLQAPDPAASPRILRGHEGGINAAALSADGRLLATGSDDTSARVWDLAAPDDALPNDPAELAKLACAAAGRNLTGDEWVRYFDGAYRQTCGT